jgi:hypothetical protein
MGLMTRDILPQDCPKILESGAYALQGTVSFNVLCVPKHLILRTPIRFRQQDPA